MTTKKLDHPLQVSVVLHEKSVEELTLVMSEYDVSISDAIRKCLSKMAGAIRRRRDYEENRDNVSISA